MDWSFMERFAPLYVQAAGLTLRRPSHSFRNPSTPCPRRRR